MIRVRTYGREGPPVVVLHGGPGAPGYMAPVARGLADKFRVIEPLQRGSGGVRLSVSTHIEDLFEVVRSQGSAMEPALVGSSWGAMLALAYAAAYPHSTGPIVLVGCGTFDTNARDRLRATLDIRMQDDLRDRLDRLDQEISDPDERLRARADLLYPLYSYDPTTPDLEVEDVDSSAYLESWNDMLRLQQEGVYPKSFSGISSPVLMLHGSWDPHPGEMIRDSLLPFLPQLTYNEWDRCGHYPWLERAVGEEFFRVLRNWLLDCFVSKRGEAGKAF